MGYDKLLSFLTKNLHNSIVDDLYDKPLNVTNHIYFDMNFIIYNSINNIENDINAIYMIIFSIPYTDIRYINKKLHSIFNTYYWKKVLEITNINIYEILDGNNINDILKQFKLFIDNNSHFLLYYNIVNLIHQSIILNHPLQFIRSINLFIDGIPTYSKIIEQRKRRMKKYLDSKNRKKLFNHYFDNINKNLVTEDNITYDYFEWIKHLYSYDKSMGPFSPSMIQLSSFILIELKIIFNNINVTMNNSNIAGESDYKIFKHIKDNMIDCDITIHSCDSDFIYMIIWYQLLFCNNNNDINLMLIYYTKSTNISNKILIQAKKINISLLEKYKIINNINNDININIIFDLLFIIMMFGNDIIPPSYELGVELNLKILFESHYNLYKNDNFIITLNNICIINFINLSKWLIYIKNRNSFSLIILSRFYNLPYNIINGLTEKYNLINIIDKVIIPYCINNTDINTIDESDFRKTLKSNIPYVQEPCIANINLFDYMDMSSDDCGLILYNRGYDITSNSYQTLYNMIAHTAYNNTTNEYNMQYNKFFSNIKNCTEEYEKMTKNYNVKQYIMTLIYSSLILFYDFDLYTPTSLFYCSNNYAPSLDSIINFITTNDMNKLHQECILKMKEPSEYFNPISHHFFITPYLLEKTYIDSMIEITHIESFINIINTKIPGIWYKEGEHFILKDIDPLVFIKLSNDLIQLYQDPIMTKIFKNCNNTITL